MAPHNRTLHSIYSTPGYRILPAAPRFVPITLNTSRPVVCSPEALEFTRVIPKQLNFSISTSSLLPVASSASSDIDLSSSPPAITLTSSFELPASSFELPTSSFESVSSFELPTLASNYITSAALTATPSFYKPFVVPSQNLAFSTRLDTTTTVEPPAPSTFPTPALGYSSVISSNTDSNLTTIPQLTPSPSIYPTESSTPTQSPTSRTPSLNTTHLGLVVGFSIFGAALIIGALITFLRRHSAARRSRKDIHWPVPPTPTRDGIQFETEKAAKDQRGYRTMTPQPEYVEEVESSQPDRVEDIEILQPDHVEVEMPAPEVEHRIKSPYLEAWKKGVVLELEGEPELELLEPGHPAQNEHDENRTTGEPENTMKIRRCEQS